MPEISQMTEPRLVRVRDADKIYIWSVKYQKLIRATRHNFNRNECEICIPTYTAAYGTRSPCSINSPRFSRLKRHILSAENKFGRELMWAKKSEIPDNLVRDREIGDLHQLENEPILKIAFRTVTLVNYSTELRDYFKANGCPCTLECSVALGNSVRSFFDHLSYLEKSTRTYMVFKSDLNELNKYQAVSVSNAITSASRSEQHGSSQSSTIHSSVDRDLKDQTGDSSQNDSTSIGTHLTNLNQGDESASDTLDHRTQFSQSSVVQNSTPIVRKRGRPRKKKSRCSIETPLNNTPLIGSKGHVDSSSKRKVNQRSSVKPNSTQCNLPESSAEDGRLRIKSRLHYDLPSIDLIGQIDSDDQPTLNEHKANEQTSKASVQVNSAEKESTERSKPIDFNNLVVDEEIEIILVDSLPTNNASGFGAKMDQIDDANLKRNLPIDKNPKRLKSDRLA